MESKTRERKRESVRNVEMRQSASRRNEIGDPGKKRTCAEVRETEREKWCLCERSKGREEDKLRECERSSNKEGEHRRKQEWRG